ncbi:hypothetical protein BDF20DRAFT_832768 [Mycotypha africana]|uniref:uncharacterized protein n=1 Tax=Mycotypha africana TaxID=64632 RepID=UPI0023011143|nr:uncharacterized protein BDF20DRAFT_832768 [Mycotypha africana]KAI8987879.1 hypothetical protein BDF20DRAFT_832768 [Mycotypha africana]
MENKTTEIDGINQLLTGHQSGQQNQIDDDVYKKPSIASGISKPPSYERTMRTQPPPPSYKQSTRLYYNNQPYIKDNEFMFCTHCHFNRYNYSDMETNTHCTANTSNGDFSDDDLTIATTKRMRSCIFSWYTTLRDAKLVFFAFFVIFTLVILGLVIPFVRYPHIAANS